MLFVLDAFLRPDLFPTLNSRFCCFSIDDLMEATEDITTTDIFEGSSCLDKQAALGDLNSLLFPVTCPNRQSWVPRLAVNSHETDVVVPSSENCTNVIFLKVGACRSEQVGSALHAFCESLTLDTHAKSCHFSKSENSLVHLQAPLIHFFLPVWEVTGNNLGEVVSCSFWPFSNLPHVAPLSIKNGFQR